LDSSGIKDQGVRLSNAAATKCSLSLPKNIAARIV
jgi:hypothetical protein